MILENKSLYNIIIEMRGLRILIKNLFLEILFLMKLLRYIIDS